VPLYVWLAAASVIAGVAIILWTFFAPASAQTSVRDNLAARGELTGYRDMDLARSMHERMLRPAVGALAARGRKMTTDGVIDSLSRRLELAGLSSTWTVEQLLALQVGCAILGGVGGLVYLMLTSVSPLRIVVALLFALIGYLLPSVWLSRRSASRQAAIALALADTMDQVTISVEAGTGFDTALARAARSGEGPLAEELMHALRDIQLGVPRETAFDRMAKRTDVLDLRQLVHAIRQAERYGLPVARTLRVQTEELRERRRARAEEQAMKVPVKIVFPLVFCILPALFVVVLGPAALNVFNSLS
jgi:tight adherence protein C